MRYFRPPQPDQIRHAQSLLRDGWRPDGMVRPGAMLATVHQRDTLQHVEIETWAVLAMLLAPVRGEVKA